jgi:hypothetical protein
MRFRVAQCGKFQLMDRLLTKLKAEGHKVRLSKTLPSDGLQQPPSFASQNPSEPIYCRLSSGWRRARAPPVPYEPGAQLRSGREANGGGLGVDRGSK